MKKFILLILVVLLLFPIACEKTNNDNQNQNQNNKVNTGEVLFDKATVNPDLVDENDNSGETASEPSPSSGEFEIDEEFGDNSEINEDLSSDLGEDSSQAPSGDSQKPNVDDFSKDDYSKTEDGQISEEENSASQKPTETVGCAHENTKTAGEKSATLISEGYTGDKTCLSCGNVVESGRKTSKLTYEQVITQEVLNKIEAGFLRLVNEERASKGLSALTVDSELDRAAQVRAGEIKTVFSHDRPNGESCFTAINNSSYNWNRVGENIGQTSHVSGEYFYPGQEYFDGSDEQIEKVYTKMFNAFKNSEGHYANIINAEFKHTGIGLTYGESDYEGIPYFYFAHFFGNK